MALTQIVKSSLPTMELCSEMGQVNLEGLPSSQTVLKGRVIRCQNGMTKQKQTCQLQMTDGVSAASSRLHKM